jgi:hypothetical protein
MEREYTLKIRWYPALIERFGDFNAEEYLRDAITNYWSHTYAHGMYEDPDILELETVGRKYEGH